MKPADCNLFLVGLMGVGKTSVGRCLSRLLKYPFFDSDKEIEARTGVSIPWIFDQEGEAGFRQREESILDELTQRRGIVLATGGGVVMSPVNRDRLKSRGHVIWLKAPLDTLLSRTAQDKNRPLLQNNPTATLQRLWEQRAPLYAEIADFSVDTHATGGIRHTAEVIMDWLHPHSSISSHDSHSA